MREHPDPKEQVAAARRSALLVPEADLVAFVVKGGDRVSWLNGLLTCDLANRKPGDAVYGLAVATKGRILSDVVVVLGVERVLLLAQSAAAEELRASLDRHLMMEDAELEVSPPDGVFIAFVHGPKAAEVLAAARSAGADGGELDRTGLGGAVLVAEGSARAGARSAVVGALEAIGGLWGDDAGWETLRLERGVPRFGRDFDATTYPQEASLEKVAVSFSKGCYLGQEVVCMLELRGHVKRKLVSLVLDAGDAPAKGTPLLDAQGGAVGEVTSATTSPSLGRPVALAMIKFALAEPGRDVRVGGTSAKVVDRPA